MALRTARVVAQLPPDDDAHSDWIEIQSWAAQISARLPGFPSWHRFLARTPDERAQALEMLTDPLTMIILNAAVIHSADHTTLHKMMNDIPVPFVLRVPPPRSAQLRQVAAAQAPVAEQFGFPLLEPPSGIPPEQQKAIAAERCIGAGIQY